VHWPSVPPKIKTSLITSIHSKFLGKSSDPKYKQQSTLAFNNPKDPRKLKIEHHDDDDNDDVQPAKKRKISKGVEQEDRDKDVSMGDEPVMADIATETNGHLTSEQSSREHFVTNDEHIAVPINKEGKYLIGDWRISQCVCLH